MEQTAAPVAASPNVPAEGGVFAKLGELHPRRFFLDTWRELNAEVDRSRPFDYRPLVTLVAGAVFLTLMEYFGDRSTFAYLLEWLRERWPAVPNLRASRYDELYAFGYWSFCRFLGYFALPALVVVLMPGERLAAYGLSVRGFLKHLWIYGVLFAIVLPAVIAVSFTHDFSTYYPFYRSASRSWHDLLLWEAVYGLQFLSLEFFFRGFLLSALKPSMGAYSIFAMVVPYCMIHFGKPFLECLAAIVAGTVLGTLALKTRSIWCGVLIHVTVAVSMDVAALLQTVGLPRVL